MRRQESPGADMGRPVEPRKAQDGPGEHRRAQESTGEPRRAQKCDKRTAGQTKRTEWAAQVKTAKNIADAERTPPVPEAAKTAEAAKKHHGAAQATTKTARPHGTEVCATEMPLLVKFKNRF